MDAQQPAAAAARAADDEHRPDTAELLALLLRVRADALRSEVAAGDELARIPATWSSGARNLLHYLALRRVDLRDAQREMSRLGLSSLGRCEAHVLDTLDAVIARLAVGLPGVAMPPDLGRLGPGFDGGDHRLAEHAAAALGPAPAGHATRVMVTLPSEAAHDAQVVDELVAAGMTVVRINCAHDGPAEWRAMATAVRAAAERLQRTVRVAFDLPGPKLRTGPLEPGPRVLKIKPERDAFGRVSRPAQARFGVESAERRADVAFVPLETAPGRRALRPGDTLVLLDARDRRRVWHIEAVGDGWIDATCDRTTYLTPGLGLEVRRRNKALGRSRIGPLAPTDAFIRLAVGDTLVLRLGDAAGHPARVRDGVAEPAAVSLELGHIFERLDVGHRVLFDDGAWTGVVREVSPQEARVEIVHAAGRKLKAEKGVNFPDTTLELPAFTDADATILEAIAPIADLVALSFVTDRDDVARLQVELDRLGAGDVGVVLKIERDRAFQALPGLLQQALVRPPVAVMVARGDLGVEVGFSRLAEVQEEILWLSEAAHVPVIWATQVLESLAKDGMATRAEVTDAAFAARAECVMLNKGPYVAQTVDFLESILSRMDAHQRKRTPMLRPLSVAGANRPT